MREGYWLNFRTGKIFDIDDHERWLRTPGNAKKLGVPDSVISMFKKFRPVEDRDKFLLFVMSRAPIMRIRGHGDYVTFEYNSRLRQEPLEAIWLFGKENAGPFTTFNIVNFATNESVTMRFHELEEQMESGGVESILRVAKRFRLKNGVVRELLKISKEILE